MQKKNRHKKSIAVLKRDPRFALLIKKYGLPDREPRNNPFQSLVRSIVYQQLSGKAAATILQRFMNLFPGKHFPTPKEVSAVPLRKLRAAGLSSQKSLYIKDLAQKFTNGAIKASDLYRMTNTEVIEHLVRMKGIGLWTVHMFLIATLGRLNILPTGDLGIRK